MSEQPYDTVIRAGTVVDGTGEAGRRADVGIGEGRITAIGDVAGEGTQTIDATGLIVAPGFIDVHSHDDVALINMPGMDFKAGQGVTTVVCGNCGAGAAPANERMQQFYRRGVEGILGPVNEFTWRSLTEFYDAVRAAKPSVNAAFLVPHGALRVNALGWERRAPTGDELETMKSLLAEGMDAGAVGLSTGLIYAPGTYAETDELIELAKVVSKYEGIYVSHIRNEGAQLLDAVREAIRIGEEGGCGVQISHHKASGKANFGKTKESLPVIDEARARGVDVTIDAYPYVAASTALAAIAPRGQLVREMDPHDVIVASVKYQHQYEGKRLDEIASMMDLPVVEATSKLLRDEENAAVAVMFTMDEPDIRRVFSHESCMVGSDGIPSPTGKPHPRLYGTFARVLGDYVREEGLFSIEEAVRRMTSLPAGKFRLGDRGVLREGAPADIAIFDAATIADVATYEEPRQYPSGMAHVLVNGESVVSDGKPLNSGAGAVLRRATGQT